MGKKKKRGRRAASKLSPVTKSGQIKVGTLLMEIGAGVQVYNSWQVHGKNGDMTNFLSRSIPFITEPGSTTGKIFYTGLALALLGRYVPQVRDLGLIRLG